MAAATPSLGQAGVAAGGQLAQQLFQQKFQREQQRRAAEKERQDRMLAALQAGTSFQQRALQSALEGFARATL